MVGGVGAGNFLLVVACETTGTKTECTIRDGGPALFFMERCLQLIGYCVKVGFFELWGLVICLIS